MRNAQKFIKLPIHRILLTLHMAKPFKYYIAVILHLYANDSSITESSHGWDAISALDAFWIPFCYTTLGTDFTILSWILLYSPMLLACVLFRWTDFKGLRSTSWKLPFLIFLAPFYLSSGSFWIGDLHYHSVFLMVSQGNIPNVFSYPFY